MTAAPLPAPRPANCPLCHAEMERREHDEWRWWGHPKASDCLLDEMTLWTPGHIAAWNRRAPEAQAWRVIETAPRDGSEVWGRVDKDAIRMFWHDGFGAFVSGWRRMELAAGYMPGTQPLPAPPSATPAAPPAREAALMEALREMEPRRVDELIEEYSGYVPDLKVGRVFGTMTMRELVTLLTAARAALAARDGGGA